MNVRLLRYWRSGIITIILSLLIVAAQVPIPSTASIFPTAPLLWSSLGGPQGGPAQALAVSPDYTTDTTLFAGGGRDYGRGSWAGRGLFRSQDGGVSWSSGFGPDNGAVLDIAISPNWGTDGHAIAGMWQGIWVTRDGGQSWRELSSFESGGLGMISSVAISPQFATDQTYLAGGSYGILFRSTDAGLTWQTVSGTSSVRRVVFDPGSGAIALAAAGDGLWRTADGGTTWTKVDGSASFLDVAFRPMHDTAYATNSTQVLRSTDLGQSWQALGTVPTSDMLNQLAVSQDGTGLFVSAQAALWQYDFGTSQWLHIADTPDRQTILRLAISPNFGLDHTLWLGTVNGVWSSHDGGAHFTRSQGFYPIPTLRLAATANATENNDLFAATSLGIWRRSAGEWQPKNAHLTGILASSIIDVALSPTYATDHTLFAAWVSNVSIGAELYKSTDRGETWRGTLSTGYISGIQISPDFAHDGTVFVTADQRVFQSLDFGETWSPQPYWDWTHTARRLALSPHFATDHRLIAAGSSIYLSGDGGATWHEATSPPPITVSDSPRWAPSQLAVAPTGASSWAAWLSIVRYDTVPPYQRHDQLWQSVDNGETWQQITSAPDRPIMAIGPGADYLNHSDLFLATADDDTFDEDVIPPDLYYSEDGGLHWRNLGAAPDVSPLHDILTTTGLGQAVLLGADQVWKLAPANAPTATPNPCQELLQNRSFEYAGVWNIPTTTYPAQRTTAQHQHGWWSMQTGIVDANDNIYSYSDFWQSVSLPTADQLTLRFWRRPQADAGSMAAAPVVPSSTTSRLTQLGTIHTWSAFQSWLRSQKDDLQYGLVITPDDQLHFLYADNRDDRVWLQATFDLHDFAGETVRLQFGTFNNGDGPVAAQYFDNFSLSACANTPTPTQTPTYTPTFTPTLPPTHTPTYTPTFTPTLTPTQTSTPTLTPTQTSTPTLTPTQTSTPTLTPTQTSTPTLTPTPTSTPTPSLIIYMPLIVHDNWAASFLFFETYPVYALAPPRLPKAVYVLDNRGRVWRTFDRGQNWQDMEILNKLGAPALQFGGGLIDPYDLWLVTALGLYVSHDQGQHWIHVSAYTPQAAMTVDFNNPDQLWSGGVLDSYHGVIRSTDGGHTWIQAGIGLTDHNLAYMLLINPVDRMTMFAGMRGSAGEQHLWRGQIPGLWNPITSPSDELPFPSPYPGLAFRSSDQTLWAGNERGDLVVSHNPMEMNGAQVQWQEATIFGDAYVAAPLAWGEGPSLYLLLWRKSDGNGAFLRSDDDGLTWTQLFLPGS